MFTHKPSSGAAGEGVEKVGFDRVKTWLIFSMKGCY